MRVSVAAPNAGVPQAQQHWTMQVVRLPSVCNRRLRTAFEPPTHPVLFVAAAGVHAIGDG